MTARNTEILRNLPSIKALLVFNTVARHLNFVRAAIELNMTQSALSRQVKSLEVHLGVELFKRGPRGLSFTQEGELLYDHSQRAFETLGTGIRHLSPNAGRETLIISIARSFAVHVICKKIGDFIQANPWIDLKIDVHRYFSDIDSSGADISIRLGHGDWEGYRTLALSDDRIGAVCSPGLFDDYESLESSQSLKHGLVLRNTERDYWEQWQESGKRTLDLDASPTIYFNDSAPMLTAAREGAGLCLTRITLVSDLLLDGSLKQLWGDECHDGLKYYAVCAHRTNSRRAVELFMHWLESEFAT
jgi:LysR family glycine cleavage system transcriptional activator